jgi:hypothetical protein
MKTELRFIMVICLSFFFVFTSCSKDGVDGAQGIQGIAGVNGTDGADGVAGANGTNGEDGTNGENGNAEVLYSNWIPANFNGSSLSSKRMEIDFPSAFPSAGSIKNTHLILVYFTGFGDGNVYLLPILNFRGAQFTFGFGSLGNALYTPGDISISALALSGNLTEFQIDPARGNKFRYVIIPPSTNIGGKTSIDYSDYEAVIEHYNIPE